MIRDETPYYGAIARFEGPAAIVDAATRLRAVGFEKVEGYTPFPIHALGEALAIPRSRLPWFVLIGGIVGGLSGYAMQWYLSVIDYPLIIGSKPLNSREAWVPITFELTILLGAFAAVGGLLALTGLPRLYHPAFASEAFARASDDGFFLTVEAADARFDPVNTPEFLSELGGLDVALLEN